jgi:2'-5' RNA ligase
VALSLWLMPEGGVHPRFAGLISDLAARLGTPAFEPHVTLLGGVDAPLEEVRAQVAVLARALPPIEVRLRVVDGRDEYFRCLFVAAEPTPGLVSAHEAAAHALGVARGTPFEPHLSLVYGHLDAARKESLRRELGEQPATFVARTLCLYRTEGDPSGWRLEACFRLGP